ncbi:unnamed protein product [Gordionus sp. m RMFG-2023]
MSQLHNLHDYVNYQKSFEKLLLLNESYLNCTLYKNYKFRAKFLRYLLEDISIIVLIFGVIGNSLGLYFAMRDKIMYIRVYLTRVFYAVNLINYIFMSLYPVLDLLAEFHLIPFRSRRPWKVYLINYHFPIAKTLVNFSFGIYVIFAISQLIAIVFPHYYRSNFTLYKIKFMLSICFLYYLVWYIPSGWWFEIMIIRNICGFDPDRIVYSRVFADYESNEERVGWIIFGIFRETFTRFIPVAIILALNYFSLKQKKLTLNWRLRHTISSSQESKSTYRNLSFKLSKFGDSLRFSETLATNAERTIPYGNIKTAKSTIEYNNSSNTKSKNIISDDKSKIDMNSRYIQDNTGMTDLSKNMPLADDKADSLCLLKIKQRELEYKLSIRMLAILMFEFLVLLFPVSIYLMTVDFFSDLMSVQELEIIFAACTLLEYTYISLTFYLNMIFNPAYREDTYRMFKKSRMGKFFIARKIIPIDVETKL